MFGGMRIDPRGLPLRYQEQVGASIAAQLVRAAPVAVRSNKHRVKVKALRFQNRNLAMRYLELRVAAKREMVYDLVLRKEDGLITAISYGTIIK